MTQHIELPWRQAEFFGLAMAEGQPKYDNETLSTVDAVTKFRISASVALAICALFCLEDRADTQGIAIF